MTFSELSKSSKSVEYGTPPDLFNKLNDIFEFKLDPCTTKENPLGTEHYFTKQQDGLSKTWQWNTFINPPFGRTVLDWILKMKEEADLYPENTYVMLLPARTDTAWFQDHVYFSLLRKNNPFEELIYFLRGRLKFVNPVLNAKSEPHIIGSMLWIVCRNGISNEKFIELESRIEGVVV